MSKKYLSNKTSMNTKLMADISNSQDGDHEPKMI